MPVSACVCVCVVCVRSKDEADFPGAVNSRQRERGKCAVRIGMGVGHLKEGREECSGREGVRGSDGETRQRRQG